MAHAAAEVAVGGGYSALACSEDAHVAAQAGTAGRSGNGSAGINKGIDVTTVHSLLINLLGCRDDNHTHMVANLVTFENFGSLLQIL